MTEVANLALQDLARSGLEQSDFKKLKLRALTREETDALVGVPRASYEIPYFNVNGTVIPYCRYRFVENQKQRKFSKKSQTNKGSFRYTQPANSSPHVYFPPYLKWSKVIKDTSVKILITEGEKKAALACKMGIACIALGGVYAFKSTKHFWNLIPELAQITWKDRDVEVCYDSDVMYKTEVRQALHALALELGQRHAPASMSFVFLDAEATDGKVGLDDYLLAHGVDKFNELERHKSRITASIQAINERLCFVEAHGRYYDIKNKFFYKTFNHVREAFANAGEEQVGKSQTVLAIDLWNKAQGRRAVTNIVYRPGEDEMSDHNELNSWRQTRLMPKRGKPAEWLELVRHIMRKPEYMEWFLKWLAYPVQFPGVKLLQACFIFGSKQGVGKTFIVDPVMEFIYGEDNFHRLQNEDITSAFNAYAARKQFIVTNEIYLPEYKDRRSAMSTLKDMITREKVSVNEKFQPQMTYVDYCNYYFSSNHADALILEPNDRRFFVVEAPNEKFEDQTFYTELDEWIRMDGAANILHYLQNVVDVSSFDPHGDALFTPWKEQLIDVSRDALAEFCERLIEEPEHLFMINGVLPDQELFRTEDLLKLFERSYPRYRFNVTVARMSRMLNDDRLERRNVRQNASAAHLSLYAVFNREQWRKSKNRAWADHYTSQARLYGGRGHLRVVA